MISSRTRARIGRSTTLVALGILLLASNWLLVAWHSNGTVNYAAAVVILVSVGLLVNTLLAYLKGRDSGEFNVDLALLQRLNYRLESGLVHVQKLESRIKSLELSTGVISEKERDDLLSLLRHQLESESVSDRIADLESRYSEQIASSVQVKAINEILRESKGRLQAELSALARRGNLNLVIGVLTTSVAVALLVYMVLASSVDYSSPTDLLSHYMPRLSIVVFIEIFSFFFLRLYRAGLDEIKYYQNEITNIDFKFLALEVVRLEGKVDAFPAVLEELVRTDRNALGRQGVRPASAPKELTDAIEKLTEVAVKLKDWKLGG